MLTTAQAAALPAPQINPLPNFDEYVLGNRGKHNCSAGTQPESVRPGEFRAKPPLSVGRADFVTSVNVFGYAGFAAIAQSPPCRVKPGRVIWPEARWVRCLLR